MDGELVAWTSGVPTSLSNNTTRLDHCHTEPGLLKLNGDVLKRFRVYYGSRD